MQPPAASATAGTSSSASTTNSRRASAAPSPSAAAFRSSVYTPQLTPAAGASFSASAAASQRPAYTFSAPPPPPAAAPLPPLMPASSSSSSTGSAAQFRPRLPSAANNGAPMNLRTPLSSRQPPGSLDVLSSTSAAAAAATASAAATANSQYGSSSMRQSSIGNLHHASTIAEDDEEKGGDLSSRSGRLSNRIPPPLIVPSSVPRTPIESLTAAVPTAGVQQQPQAPPTNTVPAGAAAPAPAAALPVASDSTEPSLSSQSQPPPMQQRNSLSSTENSLNAAPSAAVSAAAAGPAPAAGGAANALQPRPPLGPSNPFAGGVIPVAIVGYGPGMMPGNMAMGMPGMGMGNMGMGMMPSPMNMNMNVNPNGGKMMSPLPIMSPINFPTIPPPPPGLFPGLTPHPQLLQPLPSVRSPSTMQHPAQQSLPTPMPGSATDNRSTSPPPLRSTRVNQQQQQLKPPSPSAAADEVDLTSNIKHLLSAPTLTEREFAAARRSARDWTMLGLWVLAAFVVVTLAFHAHRLSQDQMVFTQGFAKAALGCCICGFLALLVPIIMIFLGRTLAERTPIVILLHAFFLLLVSFLLFLPILTSYLPDSAQTSAALALSASASSSAATWSSTRYLVLALVLHAVSLLGFYVIILSILGGGGVSGSQYDTLGTREGGLASSERAELHAALVAVASMDARRHEHEQLQAGMRRRILEGDREREEAARAHKREIVAQNERIAALQEENKTSAMLINSLQGIKSEAAGGGGAAGVGAGITTIGSGFLGLPELEARQSALYDARLVQLSKAHENEVKALVHEAQIRTEYTLTLSRELDVAREQVLLTQSQLRAVTKDKEVLDLQLRDAGMEQSRILELQREIAMLREENEANFTKAQRAMEQLKQVREQGKCLHCMDMQAKVDHMLAQHIAVAKTAEENRLLTLQLATLKQQLVEIHRRNERVERRNRARVDIIQGEIESFDQFTHEAMPQD